MAREVVDLIRQAGRKAVAIPRDLRTLEGCEAIVAAARKGLGGIDLLVNNAAYQQSKEDIFAISDEQMVRTFETNIFAYFRIAKAVAEGHAGGIGDPQHRVGQFLRSGSRAARLCLDQGGDPDLYQGACQTARQARDSRQHDRAGADLDSAADRGRAVAGADGGIRARYPAWSGGAARRARAALRDARVGRRRAFPPARRSARTAGRAARKRRSSRAPARAGAQAFRDATAVILLGPRFLLSQENGSGGAGRHSCGELFFFGPDLCVRAVPSRA